MNTPRSIAVDILCRIEEKGAYAEPLLDEVLSDQILSNAQDRRLLTQIVYGTLRMQGRLDWIIARLYRGRVIDLDGNVRNIIRMSLYQLFFTHRIPQFAIVDEAVKVTKELNAKAAGLVNAVLRNAIRKGWGIAYPDSKESPALYLSVYYSHPLWLVEKWLVLFGFEETEAVCRANLEIPPAAVRVNRLKTTPEEAIKDLRDEGFEVVPAAISPDGLILIKQPKSLREAAIFRKGHVQMQDEASQLISHLVAPEAGERILDLCAGTGGKTSHLAEIMKNKGEIIAVDINGRKLERLQNNAKRLGANVVRTLQGDAAGPLVIDPHVRFDKILIDAPCSGLGTLRRNPEIKWRIMPQAIKKSAALQTHLIKNAARYLKDGGILIYSTCTNLPEENEDIITDFMENNRVCQQLRPPETTPPDLVSERGFFRTKTHLCGADGFFGAILSC
ncbi:MAG: 16S rRNA (cytosine(967)-C(5))-methyltransferase RsmB [Deltaproteobacteria bacterium]|nr:16S rRNA (cytosine(967)-C(5))-methyltransferase RsmB [Deltaproteobacteria bacterium]